MHSNEKHSNMDMGHKKITLEMRKYTEQITRIYQNHRIT